MIAATYEEVVDSIAPSTVGFGQDGGRGQTVYQCTSEDLADVLMDLLGYTEMETDDGRLRRHLPRAHPRFPWLFVDRVAQIQGRGQFTKVEAANTLESPPVSHGTSYTKYWVTVEWAPRPYALVKDENIEYGSMTNYATDGSSGSINYVEEWRRFVDWEILPRVEVITASFGQMVLRRGDASDPNGRSFPGQTQIRLSGSTVIARWFHVPYRYLTASTSYLRAYLGRINQADFADYPAGTLLFDAVRATRFTPPFPDSTSGVYGIDKMANLELVFLEVIRETPSAPTPANANWVAAGHNLLPWLGDRKFYYGTTFDPASPATTSKWVPTYLSVPFQLLFMDPEA